MESILLRRASTNWFSTTAARLASHRFRLKNLDIQPLVVARSAGLINMVQWAQLLQVQNNDQAMERARGTERDVDLVIAAHIKSKEDRGQINCIYVTDVDVLSDEMLQIRDSPIQRGVEYRYQNVAFVLNLIDSMTTRSNYIAIRDQTS